MKIMKIAQIKATDKEIAKWQIPDNIFHNMNVIIYSEIWDKEGGLGYIFDEKILQKGHDIEELTEGCFWLPAECFKNIIDLKRKCYDI
jgi:hypothetical protein